jgi:hypothetical protein
MTPPDPADGYDHLTPFENATHKNKQIDEERVLSTARN